MSQFLLFSPYTRARSLFYFRIFMAPYLFCFPIVCMFHLGGVWCRGASVFPTQVINVGVVKEGFATSMSRYRGTERIAPSNMHLRQVDSGISRVYRSAADFGPR